MEQSARASSSAMAIATGRPGGDCRAAFNAQAAATFPVFWNRAGWPRMALTAIPSAYIHGISTRSVDDLVRRWGWRASPRALQPPVRGSTSASKSGSSIERLAIPVDRSTYVKVHRTAGSLSVGGKALWASTAMVGARCMDIGARRPTPSAAFLRKRRAGACAGLTWSSLTPMRASAGLSATPVRQPAASTSCAGNLLAKRLPATGLENPLSRRARRPCKQRRMMASTLADNSSTRPCASGRKGEQKIAPFASRRRYDCKRLHRLGLRSSNHSEGPR
jgi:hypothetical protein